MSLPRRKRITPVFDFISVNLLVVAMIPFLYATTFMQHPVAFQALVAASILGFGIGMTTLFIILGILRFSIDPRISSKELALILNWLLLCMAAILIVNKVIQLQFEVSPMPANLFAVLIAISEEVLFRVFLTTWFVYMLQSFPYGDLFGIALSSGAWAVYHFAAYGVDVRAMGIILVAGFVLGYAYVQSRRASVPMLAHALINFIAVGG